MRRVLRAALVALLVAAGPAVAQPATAQDGAPTVTVDLTGAKEGDTILVRGTGWTGTELVYVELCGNGGRDGSRSCDQGQATLAGISPEGGFAATMVVAKPPVPCPCVVKATSQTTQAFATAALPIQDVPEVPLEDQPTLALIDRSVQITQAELLGRGPWTSWLGAGAHRTLRVTVTNDGDVAVHDPPISITYGKGANPSGIVPAPSLGTIEPGESVTVEVPVRYGSLSFGQHTARVFVAGFADAPQAVATTSTYPWALIVLGLVVLQVGLLALRNRVRDRVAWTEADEDTTRDDAEEHDRVLALVGAAPEEIDLRVHDVPPHWEPVVEHAPAAAPVPGTGDDDEPVGAEQTPEVETETTAEVEPEAEVETVMDADDEPDVEIDAVDDTYTDDEVAIEAAPVMDADDDVEIEPEAEAVEDTDSDDEVEPDAAAEAEPIDLDRHEDQRDEPAETAIDLREPAAPEQVPPADPAQVDPGRPSMAADARPHLPNPFEQVSGEQVNGALVLAQQTDRQVATLRRGVEEQRQEAERALESAQALASQILASAAVRVEDLVEEATTARAEAVDELDQCRRDVEELLTLARATAQAIRRDAELQREATLRAAALAQDEIDQLVAEARRTIEAQLADVEAKAAALVAEVGRIGGPTEPGTGGMGPRTTPWPTEPNRRTGTHLDSAIERAVQRALQA